MKRNETVLVYAVTGLLVLILGIAVIFGNDASAGHKPEEQRAADGKGLMDDLPSQGPAGRVPMSERPHEAGGVMDIQLPKTGGEPTTPPASEQPVRAEPPQAEPPAKAQPAVQVPLVSKPSAADEIARALGVSSRDGVYRAVKAQPGDRLITVLRRWMGTRKVSQKAIDLAIGINENHAHGGRIAAGSKVLVPWIDDGELLERLAVQPVSTDKDAGAKKADSDVVRHGTRPVVSVGTLYTVKKGDSLWTIAARRVGNRKAPGYIKQIVALNPGLSDPSYLREKQKLRLP